MKVDKYPVVVGESSMVFEFDSEGIRGTVPKLVIYSETHLHNFYNLGFGDKDEITGQIDDEVITNNGDSEKVLATQDWYYQQFERNTGRIQCIWTA